MRKALVGSVLGAVALAGGYAALRQAAAPATAALVASPAPEAAPAPGDGLRIETLPAQVAVTVGRPLVLPPRQVENGTPPYRRRLVGGPGVSLGELGTVTVSPAAAGTEGPYTLTISDANGLSASTQMYVVASAPLRLAEPRPLPATVGEPYRAAFAASGGRPPYAWSFSGQAPDGLSFANGSLSGTPASLGAVSGMVVTVADADGRQAYSGSFGIAVADPLVLQPFPPEVQATSGHPVILPPPAASGGAPPYARSLSGAGATLSPDGSVRIEPGAPGEVVEVALTVRDSAGRVAGARTRVAVAEPMRIGEYAGATLPRGIEVQVAGPGVTGGRGATRRLLLDDATGEEAPPPRGLAFSASDGSLVGIPERAGVHGPYRIRAVDAAGRSVDGLRFEIRVVEPPAATASTRREILVDGARFCTSAGASDCQRSGDFRTVEIRYPGLVRVNELAFGCDYAGPPAGVWELYDGRRWTTAEATETAPCSALIPATAVTAARFTRLAGAFTRLWAPRGSYAR